MKLLVKNQIVRDLKVGINRVSYIGIFLIFLALGISIRLTAPDGIGLCWRDYLIKIFEGTQEIGQMERTSSFYIPKEWLVVQFLFFILIAKYPKKDLEQQGIQIFIRTNSKRTWWLSKCVWLFCSGVLYYGLFYLAMAVVAIPGNSVEELYIQGSDIWQMGLAGYHPAEVNITLLVMPFLCTTAIGMLQMVISIAVSPILALCCSIAYQVLAVAIQKSWILGNYTMLCRHAQAGRSGVDNWKGIIISMGIFLTGMFLGIKYMKKKEFL